MREWVDERLSVLCLMVYCICYWDRDALAVRTLGEVDALQRRQLTCEKTLAGLRVQAEMLVASRKMMTIGSGANHPVWLEKLLRVAAVCLVMHLVSQYDFDWWSLPMLALSFSSTRSVGALDGSKRKGAWSLWLLVVAAVLFVWYLLMRFVGPWLFFDACLPYPESVSETMLWPLLASPVQLRVLS